MLEYVLKNDRLPVLAGIAGVTLLAWAYLVLLAGGMDEMSGSMAAAQVKPWSAADFALMVLMWAVMMVGMMVPSAAPMILLFVTVQRRSREQEGAFVPTGAFLAGYVVAWSGFSLGATTLQWALERAALVSPMMVSTSPLLGGVLLLAAGVYQWTPLKHACLRHCRSPIHFITRHWRRGALGALRMGMAHGIYCVGCCWVLMGLLLVGGVMNLLWIAGIALLVLLEKVVPHALQAGRVGGLLLAAAGLLMIVEG